MQAFMEHISLVMDTDNADDGQAVNLMTLHSAKGLEFDTVFLPGWEEGLFPHQRALDEGGRSGLEEERRLAYVGITRARKRAKIWFASNRRIHGLWQSTSPSRFLDELPEEHVDIIESSSTYGGYNVGGFGAYGASRFDSGETFSNSYSTPGWQRAKRNKGRGSGGQGGRGPKTIEGELVAKSVIGGASEYSTGERVFHMKFGYGSIASIDRRRVVDFCRGTSPGASVPL